MPAVERRLMCKISGEMGVKSPPTRRKFLRALTANCEAALASAGVRGVIRLRWSRLLVEADDPGRARDALVRVFGLHSVSEVSVLRFDSLDELVERAADVYRERVAGRTFAVRPKRSGTHAFDSRDLAVALGNALLPVSAGVNLGAPDVEVPIEVDGNRAYAVLGSTPGARGLPIGTGHRAVALFSGGYDSPVAAWMTMRRGTAIELVVFDLDGCGQTDVALEVARELCDRWAPGLDVRAHLVDLVPVVAALRASVDDRLRQVLLKRAMYRAASFVVRETESEAMVTGEALAQVSTQTLRNLAVAEDAADVPVLRPLIGMDKEEILERARQVGTHDASARVREHCAISTGRVETAARLGEVVIAEGRVDDAFIEQAVASRQVVSVREWEPAPRPAHVVDEVPAGAAVVDVRELEEGGPDLGMRLPFSKAEDWIEQLDRDTDYLLVCTYGVRSQLLAGELAGRGYRTRSLAGGTAALGHRAA